MIHFGTGGWRAVIGDGFTKANVQLLTLALARKMLDEGSADKGFVIGTIQAGEKGVTLC